MTSQTSLETDTAYALGGRDTHLEQADGAGVGVAVAGLAKEFVTGAPVLSAVSFRAEPGEIVALVGANGAGKSTLLRCLVRLIEPTAGVIRIGGLDVTTAGASALRRLRSRVGFVAQRFHVVPRLTVFHNVLLGGVGRRGPGMWWPALAPEAERREAMDCLGRVDLAHLAARRADSLSGGQQQRVAIARMLMQRPILVLADEPVASLDPAAGPQAMELLRNIARERALTVLVALHQLDLARQYTDRILGLRAGALRLDLASTAWEAAAIDALYARSSA